jgi:hypothetical protein
MQLNDSIMAAEKANIRQQRRNPLGQTGSAETQEKRGVDHKEKELEPRSPRTTENDHRVAIDKVEEMVKTLDVAKLRQVLYEALCAKLEDKCKRALISLNRLLTGVTLTRRKL